MTEAQQPHFQLTIIPVTGFQQNCVVMWDQATLQGAVVDPGGDLQLIEEVIRKSGATIEQILITHGHIDHAGGAAELAEKLKAPVLGPHKDDQFLLDALPEIGLKYGIMGARALQPTRYLSDGEKIKAANQEFEVRHVPGHAPGHVIYINHSHRLVLCGDTVFQGSIGRTDLPGGNHEQLLKAITEKIFSLPEDYTLLPGHGAATTVGHERQTNPYFN